MYARRPAHAHAQKKISACTKLSLSLPLSLAVFVILLKNVSVKHKKLPPAHHLVANFILFQIKLDLFGDSRVVEIDFNYQNLWWNVLGETVNFWDVCLPLDISHLSRITKFLANRKTADFSVPVLTNQSGSSRRHKKHQKYIQKSSHQTALVLVLDVDVDAEGKKEIVHLEAVLKDFFDESRRLVVDSAWFLDRRGSEMARIQRVRLEASFANVKPP